jgi:repressor LexA
MDWMKIQLLDESSACQPTLLAVWVFGGHCGRTLRNSMPDTPKLTTRQQQILDLVRSAIERTGAPPTRAEIAKELGFRSANAAEEHLQALARKGAIELVGGTSRGIRLTSDTLRSVNENRGKQYSLPLPSLAQLNLPLVGRVAAGHPILAQEHIEQTYVVEASMFPRRPDYLLKVRGLSMRDAGIMDGDLLAVQKTSEARNGQIVVARLGDEVTVKRFHRTATGIELLPENPDFEPIVVSLGDEDFELEGVAVGLIRNNMLM